MGVYRITTDQGVYDVTTDDGASATPQPQPSPVQNAINTVQQHPVQTAWNLATRPVLQNITGKTASDMAMEASAIPIPQSNDRPFDRGVQMASQPLNRVADIGNRMGAGMDGSVADIVTTPANYVLNPLAKGAINAVGGTLENIPNVLNTARAANLEQTINKAFVGVKKAATDKFGADVEDLVNKNPDKTVSLRNVVDNIQQNMDEMAPEAKAVFRKTPILSDLLKNPDAAENVSLKDTQDILNYINTKVPKTIKANHLDILDALNDIKASQLDAFPEMAGVKADYQKVIEPYNQVKKYFRFNKTLNSIQSDFGGPSGIEAVKKLGLPDDVIQQMGGYKNAAKIIKAMPKIAKYAGGALVGGSAAGGAYYGLSRH